MNAPLLEIARLRIDLPGRSRRSDRRTVLHDVSFTVSQGESVGVVGESGSGKSMTTKAIMGLLPEGSVSQGDIAFRGESLSSFDKRSWATFRSRDVSMIHQDPRAGTNPLHTVGDFLLEGVVATGTMTRSDAMDRAIGLLKDIGIADAERRMGQYPHQLSGGLLQRMMIVMALMPEPALLLADEPTTALDVTVQAEVAAILIEQLAERDLGMVFITHDLDLAAAITDTLAVMYAGVIVESGPSSQVTRRPRHPYTAGLLRARPKLSAVGRLDSIPGRPLSAFEVGPGCVFASRCAYSTDQCESERPVPRDLGGQVVACHRAEELEDELIVREQS